MTYFTAIDKPATPAEEHGSVPLPTRNGYKASKFASSLS